MVAAEVFENGPTLLIVDDDKAFVTRLARAMEARGYAVRIAESAQEGLAAIQQDPPSYAVIDMRLGDGNGIDLLAALAAKRPDARGIILTGYGNIATADGVWVRTLTSSATSSAWRSSGEAATSSGTTTSRRPDSSAPHISHTEKSKAGE